jgi:autotransporter family porin
VKRVVAGAALVVIVAVGLWLIVSKRNSSSKISTSMPAAATAPTPTLAPGGTLPSDATCSAQVQSVPETRPPNTEANHTRGVGGNKEFPRVTGNDTGTTDEIIQWVACKWGIDANVVRAQAAVESWWFQSNPGDFSTDASTCVPGHRTMGADGISRQCPQSIGILQNRYPYHMSAFVNDNATKSTAYNLDYAYAVWRQCYEGDDQWLNSVDHGATYKAGDLWGCVGVWYSGRWYTAAAVGYINKVKGYLDQKTWVTDGFLSTKTQPKP